MFRPRAKVKSSQPKKVRLKGLSKGKTFNTRLTIWLCGLQKQRMPLSYYHNAHAKCAFKENQTGSRDVIIEKTHIKEQNVRLKMNELVCKAKKLTGYLPKLSLLRINVRG